MININLTYLELFQLICIIGFIFILFAISFEFIKPIIRLFCMDRLLGDNSLSLEQLNYKHLFYKFYLIKSKRGKLLFYIGNESCKLEDGKRITERFFIFRKKDNKIPNDVK